LISQILSFLLFLYFLIAPFQVLAIQENIDLSSAQTSVGRRFAKVFCEAKKGGLNTEAASEYALNNTYLKFVTFPDDQQYLDDLWESTSEIITETCGPEVDIEEIKELEIFFREEGIIASNRDLYLPTFENS
tara:strand:+ start:3491 stop:3886 length:396 start_codon:yes stop_codon:yes gene_type:complete